MSKEKGKRDREVGQMTEHKKEEGGEGGARIA